MAILNKISKCIRQTIGVLIPKDPEVERVVAALLERMKDHDKWRRADYHTIRHKEFNIQVWKNRIEKPDGVWIPFRWKAHVQEHINVVMRTHQVDNLHFVHDVISGKYVYQVKNISEQDKVWLAENASSDEYAIVDHWIYFLNEETAMGFKLAMQ